jgi:predicted MFS family arabinose efflux permease
MFAGQYFGIMLGGGVAVFVSGLFGFKMALACISGLLFLNLLFVLFFVRDPYANPRAGHQDHWVRKLARSMVNFVREVHASFWKSGSGPIIEVVFALLPTGAMALAYALLATLQVDYGLHTNQIASLQIYNTVASSVGCLLGGVIGDRFGIKKTVAVERIDYATVFYLDALFAVLVILVIPFLRGREAHPAESRPPVASELPAVAGVQD